MDNWQDMSSAPTDGRFILMHAAGWPFAALARWDVEIGAWNACAPFRAAGELSSKWMPLPPNPTHEP